MKSTYRIALFALLSFNLYAQDAAAPVEPSTQPAAGTAQQPANQPDTTSQQPANQTDPAEKIIPAEVAQPPQGEAQNARPQEINCDYKIPPEKKEIDNALVMEWAKNAAVQSFDLDHTQMDQQVQALEKCYTTQGWKGFNDAIEKSGNLKSIKEQQLMVKSQVDGQGEITDVSDKQWKVTLPLQVVYQNDKDRLVQNLRVTLNITRKTNGDLGILQLIAIPRQNEEAKPNTTTAPARPDQQPGQTTPQTGTENTGTR